MKKQTLRDRPIGVPRGPRKPDPFPRDRQTANFSPKFDRLTQVLARDPTGLELKADPTAMAPERVLVFEVRGSLSAFAGAVQRVRGLELIDEEELVGDDEDKAPVAYLMVPDVRALREIESLWRRWQNGELAYGEGAWRDVFDRLRNLRPWGPTDRIDGPDREYLLEEIEGLADNDLVKIEIEVVFRESDGQARDQ